MEISGLLSAHIFYVFQRYILNCGYTLYRMVRASVAVSAMKKNARNYSAGRKKPHYKTFQQLLKISFVFLNTSIISKRRAYRTKNFFDSVISSGAEWFLYVNIEYDHDWMYLKMEK